ncbi:dTMP kinase [Stieleria varia]|uniref:Thymidylate kinase n=1 Tax=Stieleria varia TaxID=2528005 RepID=A0A5C6BAP1_9BACT|nr:dTMP kinase [Stieleria varia]TWU08349.1 Thymidylate kinase [Stieleria varia]
MFITLDGIDGVGKSTQIASLQSHLENAGHQVVTVRDPGSTEIGARLRSLLLDSDLTMHRRTEAMLFMASRCEMVETIIRPALALGKVVISDRFLLSTVVYQSIGDSEKQAIAPTDLWQLGRLANNGLIPDLTILLDLSAATSMQRITGPTDRMESRGTGYMESVRQAFLQQLPHSSPETMVIDAEQDIGSVASEIRRQVDEFLNRYQAANNDQPLT